MTADDKIKVSDIITKAFVTKAIIFLLLFSCIFYSGYLIGKEYSCGEALDYAIEYANQKIEQHCPLAVDTVSREIGDLNLSLVLEVNHGKE